LITSAKCNASATLGNLERAIPDEPKRYPQWVAWRYEARSDPKAKPKKPPYSPQTGSKLKGRTPAELGTFEQAVALAQNRGMNGVGFFLTQDDPFTAVDLDGCVDPQTGEIEPWAVEIIERLDSYTEASPSGTGVRLLCKAKKPGPHSRRGKVEVYDRNQYITITGSVIGGRSNIRERQDVLTELYRDHLAREDDKAQHPRGFASSAAPHNTKSQQNEVVNLPDEALLKKARNAQSGPEFRRLYYEGGFAGFPSQSEADLALCGMLAYWTGRNGEQMDRIFRGSALMRPKWNQRRGEETYGTRTIRLAIQGCKKVYTGGVEEKRRDEPVRGALAELAAFAMGHPWTGKRGPRKRHVYSALIDTGGGRLRDGGVEVRVDRRSLALEAGIGGRDSLAESLADLEKDALIERLDPAEDGVTGTYLLKTAHARSIDAPPPTVSIYGPVLSRLRKVRDDTPPTVPEVKVTRRDGERLVRSVGYMRPAAAVRMSIGKLGALVLEKILLAGPGGITGKELGRALDRRAANLRSRQIRALLTHGFAVEVEEDVYRAAPDLARLLERHLEDSGCLKVGRHQSNRYEHERKLYASRLRGEHPAEVAPTDEELKAKREHMRKVYEEREREDFIKRLMIEREARKRRHRKNGSSSAMFVREELKGVTGMSWASMLARWEEQGGGHRDLRRGIEEAGARLVKEYGDYYVYYLEILDERGGVAV